MFSADGSCLLLAGVALAYDMCLGHERMRLERGEGIGFAAAEKELEIVEQLCAAIDAGPSILFNFLKTFGNRAAVAVCSCQGFLQANI